MLNVLRPALVGLILASLATPLGAQALSRALGQSVAWHVVDSDSAVVSGLVLHHQSGPVSGARITIMGLGAGAVSDARGYFRFPAPPPGEWELVVEKLGFDPLSQRIVLPTHSAVEIVALLAGDRAICSNACIGTWCEDLGIVVVDATTGRRLEKPVVLRVGFEGSVRESITPPDPDSRAWITVVGLGEAINTVGWHSLEVAAEAYLPWRRDRVWLENVPWCHGQLIGREHRAELVPVSTR